jgi:hypothetical protein
MSCWGTAQMTQNSRISTDGSREFVPHQGNFFPPLSRKFLISLRLLALILCSNCSNTFNKVFWVIDPNLLNYFLKPRRVPSACTTSSTHGLSISRTALTRVFTPPTRTPTPYHTPLPQQTLTQIISFQHVLLDPQTQQPFMVYLMNKKLLNYFNEKARCWNRTNHRIPSMRVQIAQLHIQYMTILCSN